MTYPKLAIVICNYNKKEYLSRCIASILASKLEQLTLEVVVVDNNSGDGSREMIRENFKDVILIENPENTGGAGGFAMGMQYAIEKKYDYISLLDNDTMVDPDAFENLVRHLQNNPAVGVVGATILQMDYPDKIQEMGARIDPEYFFLNLLFRDYDINTPLLPEYISCDYVPACCFMTTAEVLSSVGTFNPDFFIYFDDIDWCTRVKNKGYEIDAIKNAKVWHKGGAREAANTIGPYYFTRNNLKFFSRYMLPSQLEIFIEKTVRGLSEMTYFANKKGLTDQVRSVLIALDDAYANRMGPQWHAVFPKQKVEHKMYQLVKEKRDILIIDNTNCAHLKQIINNIQFASDAAVTLLLKNSANPENRSKVFSCVKSMPDFDGKDPVSYFESYIRATCKNVEIIKEMPSETAFDMIIQSTDHICEYREFEAHQYYIDAFGNWIIDTIDKQRTDDYTNFLECFNLTVTTTLEHKIRHLFHETNIYQLSERSVSNT